MGLRNASQGNFQALSYRAPVQHAQSHSVWPTAGVRQTPELIPINQNLSFVERKMKKNEKLSELWLQISRLALEQDYQSAYDLALGRTDDIYLLRLLALTGPVVSRGLSESTSRRVLQRINKIVRGGIIQKMQLDWLDDARKTNLLRNLGHSEQNEYLDTLFQYACPESDLVK